MGSGKTLIAIVAMLLASAGGLFIYRHYTRELAAIEHHEELEVADLYNASNHLFKRGRRDRMTVCLTIDDGPHPRSLPKILETLREYNVKATFFMVGRRILENSDEVREVLREGHEIGNHTQNHDHLDRMAPDQIRTELALCEHNFEQASGGAKMTLFRAPGMRISPVVLKIANEFGYTTVSANYGAKDFQIVRGGPTIANEDLIVKYVLDNVKPGGIILLHDAPETAIALPAILKGLKERGYDIKTVTEMLEELPNPVYVESNAGHVGKLAMK